MHFNWETLAHQPEMEHENAEILFTNIKPGGWAQWLIPVIPAKQDP
jgi:hypothetical protein